MAACMAPYLVPIIVSCPDSLADGKRFLLLDRQLDTASSGPTFLRHPKVAASGKDLVHRSQEIGIGRALGMGSDVDHVHVLSLPHKRLCEVTRAVKNTSAREPNLIPGRTGLRFCRTNPMIAGYVTVRNLGGIVRYIEWNPVSVGTVERAEMWPWSSASKIGDW